MIIHIEPKHAAMRRLRTITDDDRPDTYIDLEVSSDVLTKAYHLMQEGLFSAITIPAISLSETCQATNIGIYPTFIQLSSYLDEVGMITYRVPFEDIL